MRRFGRVFCCLAVSLLVGSLAAPPAAGQVWDLWFDEPHDGTTWHRGDVIRARIVPAVPVSMSGSHPVLELVLGENTRRVEGRIYQNGSRAQFYYTVQSVDAADDDEVRMAKVSLAGVEVDLSGFTPTTHAVDGGSRGVPPAIDGIGLSSFFVPAGNVYRPGDEIYWYVRFHKAVAVSGEPVLAQRIGEEMREARYRPDVRTLDGVIYFTYTVQAGDCDMDGVGIPADAISGGSIREADGSRSADTSHAAQDPSRGPAGRRHPAGGLRGGAGRPGPGAGPAGVAPAGRRRASGPAAPPHLNAPQPRRGLDAGDQRSPTPAYH